YFKNHLTNAIAEGINSIIQTTKRRARGFHTFDTFATMIYLTCGKLELATPILSAEFQAVFQLEWE
ncbi:MAG: transposase, partial [Bifidobacteriaceae bacterium]|nr:transposase [Bifidobacteriaceae bacterium]